MVLALAAAWWRDVLREAQGGHHTLAVQRGLTVGVLLFFLSELMLFLSFFWAYFHASLSPGAELGNVWPPRAVEAIAPGLSRLAGAATVEAIDL